MQTGQIVTFTYLTKQPLYGVLITQDRSSWLIEVESGDTRWIPDTCIAQLPWWLAELLSNHGSIGNEPMPWVTAKTRQRARIKALVKARHP
jgi:hypothetical protein